VCNQFYFSSYNVVCWLPVTCIVLCHNTLCSVITGTCVTWQAAEGGNLEAGHMSDATASGPASDDEASSMAATVGSMLHTSPADREGSAAGSDSGGSQVDSVSGVTACLVVLLDCHFLHSPTLSASVFCTSCHMTVICVLFFSSNRSSRFFCDFLPCVPVVLGGKVSKW